MFLGVADDGLLALLHPGWRLVIGVAVAITVVVASYRLAQRGPSRMLRAMGVSALIIVGLIVLTLLIG